MFTQYIQTNFLSIVLMSKTYYLRIKRNREYINLCKLSIKKHPHLLDNLMHDRIYITTLFFDLLYERGWALLPHYSSQSLNPLVREILVRRLLPLTAIRIAQLYCIKKDHNLLFEYITSAGYTFTCDQLYYSVFNRHHLLVMHPYYIEYSDLDPYFFDLVIRNYDTYHVACILNDCVTKCSNISLPYEYLFKLAHGKWFIKFYKRHEGIYFREGKVPYRSVIKYLLREFEIRTVNGKAYYDIDRIREFIDMIYRSSGLECDE